jgi:hypothetical protein
MKMHCSYLNITCKMLLTHRRTLFFVSVIATLKICVFNSTMALCNHYTYVVAVLYYLYSLFNYLLVLKCRALEIALCSLKLFFISIVTLLPLRGCAHRSNICI